MIQDFSEILKVLLQISQVVALIYAGYKFTRKPHDTLESKHEELKKRVDEHDLKIKEIDESLNHGNDNFREQKNVNELMIRSVFALVAFEIDYCYKEGKQLSEELKDVHDDLQRYLARK